MAGATGATGATPRSATAEAATARAERLARLQALTGGLRPLTLAGERRLPVLPALEALLPGAGLQRGTSIAVSGPGATTLTQAILAGPTRAGSWAAFVGGRRIGWAAATELGVALERVAVVEVDQQRRAAVLATLVEAFDLVVVDPGDRLDRNELRRLDARVRERGSVLVVLESPTSSIDRGRGVPGSTSWPGADVRLVCGPAEWVGPGAGWGHLRSRRVAVVAEGRRSFDRPRRVDLWLPGPDGVQIVEEHPPGSPDHLDHGATATVVAFGRSRVG